LFEGVGDDDNGGIMEDLGMVVPIFSDDFGQLGTGHRDR
jgi:hypothetical protein